jgi:hypothetical protein
MKTRGPLLSNEARGTIGPCLTFSKRRSGQQVRLQKKQKDKNSFLQREQRAAFEKASFACRFMDFGEAFFGVSIYGHEKVLYNEKAEKKDFTGYNLCIKENISTFS